jgi:oligopeptide/dipeptide ABC transporter ATP-binding protein
MNNLLQVKNLSVGFKLRNSTAFAVSGVGFELSKGESLGIVGESGCGKTVTAMSILKLLPQNAVIESGEILYKGKNIISMSEKEMMKIRGGEIALIPQDPMTSLNPLYTVGDQILEAVEIHHKVSKKEAKNIATEALKSVQIPEAEKRFNDYPHQFSGGMRQRVIIGMALSCNPDLIIADEPTTALDVTVQAQILDLIKQIQHDKGTSLLLITHDLGVVAEVCDRVAVMYAGRIVEHASVGSIFETPLHPYTIGLMKSLPDTKSSKLTPIKGQPPAITDKIQGCPFHPRCSKKMQICEKIEPNAIEIKQNHNVSCHLYKKQL